MHADRRVRVLTAAGPSSAVLAVPLEEYVARTVAAETTARWEIEALRAQAVASRTYALYRLTRPRSVRYDVLGGVLDQPFLPALPVAESVCAAVVATGAEYLTEAPSTGLRPPPLRGFFHANCGGATDSAASVWGGGDEDPVASCLACAGAPFSWTATLDVDEVMKAMGWPQPACLPVALRFFAAMRMRSGRLGAIRIEAGARSITLPAETLRGVLGYHRARSARFEWSFESHRRLRLDGVGAGHGVGMCQAGARALAAGGRSYAEILAHYYPGSRLERLPARDR